MGKFAKLVDTEEKIVEFKKRYGIPEDVHIRYVPYGDLALVLNQDLVLPMVAIIEGGCAPNVFRIVMGTAVLMEKLGLDLTVHDITYVYSLQATGRDQYTLFARNAYRKLVTGLPDSSKGRDEDFLVFTGNWQNPHINCSLRPGVPDKEFTAKKVELVERRTVEHLLQKPCFIDSGDKEEVTVVRPGKDQEDIIQAVPLTARKGVQVPRLVPPLSDPNFIPSIESSEAGLPIIRFPSIFDPDPKPTEDMPIQKRTVNIADVLRTSAPESSRTSPSASPLPPPPGFSQGEGIMRKKRKRGTAQDDDGCGRGCQDDLQQPWSCSFLLENRSVDEGDSVLKSGRGVRGGQVAEAVGKALLLPEDMKVWQEKRSKHMLENLKRDSILAVQGIFEAGNRLLETERRLNLSAEEIKRLKDLESSASAELQRKLDSERKSASEVRIENSQLKDALTEAEAKVAEAGQKDQAYYDQGFNQASESLREQLKGECNKYFVQGWHKALDSAGRKEMSWRLVRLPLKILTVPGSHEALSEPVLVDDPRVTEDMPDDQIHAAESQEGGEGSDVDETIDVVD
uniref:Uncharacterized protein n=1 Tax=Fagus sylvatica TaxID=28930 RepID=A0A2N9GXF3_FAGSY